MRRVTRGATRAWKRPPGPTLPNLWIRSSNQYGAPCGLSGDASWKSRVTALDGDAKVAGFTTTLSVVGVTGLALPVLVGLLSKLPSASGARSKRSSRYLTSSGTRALAGLQGMAIESNRFFGDEPPVRPALKMFASMSLPDFQYVLNRQTAGGRSKTLTQFWRRGQLGATAWRFDEFTENHTLGFPCRISADLLIIKLLVSCPILSTVACA